MRSQLACQEYGRRAVCTANDTDGSSLGRGEAHQVSHDKGGKDAQLCGSAQQQALGVGNQRAEVGHCTHAQENKAGINAQLDTDVEDVQQASVGQNMPVAVVERTVGIQELVVPELRVEQIGAGEVGEQHTECDGQKQQRLILFHDGQIEQEAGDDQHHQSLPPAGGGEHLGKAGVARKLAHSLAKVKLLSQQRHRRKHCDKAHQYPQDSF